MAVAAEEPFVWEAPIACPGGERVLAEVEVLLGAPPEFSEKQSIRGVVQARRGDWQLALTVTDGPRRQSRVIIAPTCDELVPAAGLAIALALGSQAETAPAGADASAAPRDVTGSEVLANPGQGSADGAREQAPAVPAAPSRGLSETRGADPSGHLEAGVVVDGVALPSAALGVALAAGLTWHALAGFAYALILPARELALAPSARVDFSLLGGGVSIRYELMRFPVGLGLCGGIEVGQLEARGSGLVDGTDFADWWIAPNVGGVIDLPLGGAWYLHAEVLLLSPSVRGTYRVNAGQLVHQPSRIGARGALAIGFAFAGAGE